MLYRDIAKVKFFSKVPVQAVGMVNKGTCRVDNTDHGLFSDPVNKSAQDDVTY